MLLPIAKIGLAQGRIGYYDELSGINLTLSKSVSDIAPGTNTTNLIKDVKEGKIVLIQGSFVPQTSKTAFRKVAPLYVQPVITKNTVVEITPEVKEEKVTVTEPVKETVVEETKTIVDNIKEEPIVTTVEEEKEVEPKTEEKE